MSQQFLSELWALLIVIGRPTLLGGLALVLVALVGLLLTRKHRAPCPRDPWKRIAAVLVGLIALSPLFATGALAAMQQSGVAVQKTALLIQGVKAIPGAQVIAVLLLAWLAAQVPVKRRAWYSVYGIACIFTTFGGTVMLLYVLR